MIIKENITIEFNEKSYDRVKIYSDSGFFIKKIGTEEIYSEAIDLVDSGFEYEETDQKIETEDSAENSD